MPLLQVGRSTRVVFHPQSGLYTESIELFHAEREEHRANLKKKHALRHELRPRYIAEVVLNHYGPKVCTQEHPELKL